MRAPSSPERCPPGDELTSLAHGEGDGAARAALLRHLLSCAACRRDHDAAQSLLLDLADLGAARSTRAPSALAAPVSPTRRRSRVITAWLPPFAAAALLALALPLSLSDAAAVPSAAAPLPPNASAGPASSLSVEARQRLVASQTPDGRWKAEAPLTLAPGDVCATGLGLLALLQDGTPRDDEPATLDAVGRATRWLEGEAERVAGRAGGGSDALRSAALATSALLRAAQLRPDLRTEAALEQLVPALARHGGSGAGDHATRPWVDYALREAGRRGWYDARVALRDLERQAPALSPDTLRVPLLAATSPSDCTPIGIALAVLRSEPPVRTLAMAPACRLPSGTLR